MDKLLTFILIIAAPFIVIGIVYLFGWLLTGLIMLFGVSYASASKQNSKRKQNFTITEVLIIVNTLGGDEWHILNGLTNTRC